MITQENTPQPADIKELLNRTDRFAVLAGCRITEVDERHAVAVMTVTEAHLNGGNVCQGGALFTLADLAIAALMNHGGQLTFGISSSLMFVSSARLGDTLTAEAVTPTTTRSRPSRCASPIRTAASSATSPAWATARTPLSSNRTLGPGPLVLIE